MKQGFRAALLLGVLFGLGLSGQGNAATETRKTQPVARKADEKPVAATSKQARKAAPTAAKTAAKSAPKTARKDSGRNAYARHDGARKSIRRVST